MVDAQQEHDGSVTASRPDHRPTLRDVARLAGVHPSTASRALAGTRPVKPELARAVEHAARKLDYRVNHIGRALRAQSTGTIGMVVPDIANPFFTALVQAVERALHLHDAGLFLCDADNDPEIEADRIVALQRRQVDGVIISPAHHERSAAAVREVSRHVPVVQVDRVVDVPTDIVGVDQNYIIRAVVDHLEAIGRHQFAYITSDPAISTVGERVAAYRALLVDRADALERIYIGDLSLGWGSEAVARILAEEPPRPDALICANDLIALGAMQRLRALGIKVPDEIAVTGVDDTPFSRIAEPELTTVRQPLDQMAQEAVALLLARRQESARAPRRLTLTPELIIRPSSQPRMNENLYHQEPT